MDPTTLKLTIGQLSRLFNILRGSPDPSSPWQLDEAASHALQLVEQAIQDSQVTWIDLTQEVWVLILPNPYLPMGAIWQTQGILECLHVSHLPMKSLLPYLEAVCWLISKGRWRCKQLLGLEPNKIIVPYSAAQQIQLWETVDYWQIALAACPRQIDNHYPADKLLWFSQRHPSIFPRIVTTTPISGAVIVFTDGSSSGKARVYTPQQTWVETIPSSSAQRVDLYAVCMDLIHFVAEPINIYSDSHYVVHTVWHIESAILGHISSEELFHLCQITVFSTQ